jgi:hypothetical protein
VDAPLAPVDARTLPQAGLPPPSLTPLGGLSVTLAPPGTGAGARAQDSTRPAPAAVPAPTVPTAPSWPSTRPSLNLSLPSAQTSPSMPGASRLLNLMPPPPERKSTLAEGIEKAARPDCRKAYGGMGALAIIPLAADALREGGCRW